MLSMSPPVAVTLVIRVSLGSDIELIMTTLMVGFCRYGDDPRLVGSGSAFRTAQALISECEASQP